MWMLLKVFGDIIARFPMAGAGPSLVQSIAAAVLQRSCRLMGLAVAKCDQQLPGASMLVLAALCNSSAGCQLRTKAMSAAPAVAAGSNPVAKSGTYAIFCAVIRDEV